MRALSKKAAALLLACLLLVLGCSCNNSSSAQSAENKQEQYREELYSSLDSMQLDAYDRWQETQTITPKETDTSSSYPFDYTVYISNYGKIHKNPNCSGMKYYTAMTYSKAKSKGYSLCQNCYG